ncbi:hypothetical protein R1sor_017773 [Riccia sorocarpa]|uniref:Uncharacterized protein n=1 Tax=Riccia sorocarpa TaxID=122646 RepID=A0ABD3I8Y0_9MARC
MGDMGDFSGLLELLVIVIIIIIFLKIGLLQRTRCMIQQPREILCSHIMRERRVDPQVKFQKGIDSETRELLAMAKGKAKLAFPCDQNRYVIGAPPDPGSFFERGQTIPPSVIIELYKLPPPPLDHPTTPLQCISSPSMSPPIMIQLHELFDPASIVLLKEAGVFEVPPPPLSAAPISVAPGSHGEKSASPDDDRAEYNAFGSPEDDGAFEGVVYYPGAEVGTGPVRDDLLVY